MGENNSIEYRSRRKAGGAYEKEDWKKMDPGRSYSDHGVSVVFCALADRWRVVSADHLALYTR